MAENNKNEKGGKEKVEEANTATVEVSQNRGSEQTTAVLDESLADTKKEETKSATPIITPAPASKTEAKTEVEQETETVVVSNADEETGEQSRKTLVAFIAGALIGAIIVSLAL